MDKNIEMRFNNLEKLVNSLIKNLNSNKENLSAIAHNNSKCIADQTPFEAQKYVKKGDTEIYFDNVPEGTIIISIDDNEGFTYPCLVERDRERVNIYFDALNNDAIVTIKVL